MAKVDIRLGTTLVQTYDGAPENLEAFIDAVNLFNDTVTNDFANATAPQKEAAQLTVLRFVKTRLAGVARQVITDAINLEVSEGDYDIIVLTETWLDDRILSTQLFGNRYTVFRTDRSDLNSKKTRGGGVLIAVSVRLNCRIDAAPIHDTLEQVWVIVETSCSDVSVGVVYLPPDRKSDSQLIQQHIDSIEMVLSRLKPHAQALVFGDYNQSGLRWFISPNGLPLVNTPRSHMPTGCCSLLDGFCLHGLTQINTALIDDERMCSVSVPHEPLVNLEAVHPAVVISVSLSQPMVFDQASESRSLNFCCADYSVLCAALSEVNCDALLDRSSCIDEAVDSFNSAIEGVINQTVPACDPPRKPMWSNLHLRSLKRLRSAALRKYCSHRSSYNKNRLNIASRQYRNYNRYLYNRYVKRIQNNLCTHPKQFWSFVNNKRKEAGLPSSMFLGDSVANNEREKCDLFAQQFQQVFNGFVASPEQVSIASNAAPRDVFSFRLPLINTEDVVIALSKLKASYTAGPDGIPSAVLKRCGEVLCSPIAKLFNLSVQQSVNIILTPSSTDFFLNGQ
ncbi:uncharacterized protein LOC129720025 [Wyeomyia smithii]|uniref:uncharacterized protein LOC129720025 n=1 Tax=Wyeomyia smithii TaxID=174621 RepID=UPI002467E962|nr:uncharacterized protein LOC129720025 [Wyeomyia smithii]